MEFRQLRGLGDTRIDHDHRAVLVVGDRLQGGSGVRDAVAHPGVLADEERHFAGIELTANRIAEHDPVDPDLAALLLADGAAAEPATEALVERRSVGTAQVVALSATAVVHDLVAAVRVTDGAQALGDLPDGRVPVDLFEGAVLASPERVEDSFASPVLVVAEPKCLLARVSLRRRVILVAADAFERLAVVAETDLDAAVALTEDAGGLLPRRLGGRVGGLLRGDVGSGGLGLVDGHAGALPVGDVRVAAISAPASSTRSIRASSWAIFSSNDPPTPTRSVVTPLRS